MSLEGSHSTIELPPLGGGRGIQTPDPLVANQTLYQLSYTPVIGSEGGIRTHGFAALQAVALDHSATSLNKIDYAKNLCRSLGLPDYR
jgi:hypothetical protein